MYQLGTNYVSAERNHMAAAIDDDNFFKPPSDIDMLCQPVSEEQKTTAEKILFTIAEVIFAEYGVLTQIHLSEPKKEKSFISFDDLNAAGGLKAFQKS